jgi:hypothetical protein
VDRLGWLILDNVPSLGGGSAGPGGLRTDCQGGHAVVQAVGCCPGFVLSDELLQAVPG